MCFLLQKKINDYQKKLADLVSDTDIETEKHIQFI